PSGRGAGPMRVRRMGRNVVRTSRDEAPCRAIATRRAPRDGTFRHMSCTPLPGTARGGRHRRRRGRRGGTGPPSLRAAGSAIGRGAMQGALTTAELETVVRILPRYVGAGPRYTSYPTVPVWQDAFPESEHRRALARSGGDGRVSLYTHVPFCRSLCHFCACNRII